MSIDASSTLDPDLQVREELISIHALNPFTPHSSSPRGLMMSGHISQIAVIEGGEPQIVQSGVSNQLAEHTFRIEVERDAHVICMLKRYTSILSDSDSCVAEHVLIVQYRDNLELDIISVPRYHKVHYKFGFKYKLNKDVFVSNIQNMTIPGGTVIADSPTVNDEGDYCFGVPANTLYAHVPEVTGDGVIISKSLAKKYKYRTYEHIVLEFGEGTFPLNLYGDDDNYKPFPGIGESVRSDRVVAATREYDNLLAPILLAKDAVKEYSAQFDKPFYSRISSGTVVDIKVYKNDKARKSTYTETTEQVDKYAVALKQHYQVLLKVFEEREHAHMTQFRKSVPVTERLHRTLIDAYAMSETRKNVKFTHKNDPVDLYRVELTIEHVHYPELRGPKFTTLSGTKGVVVRILEDEDMPVDVNGIRADIVMDPTSIPG